MPYKIENIGSQFDNKAIASLEEKLNAHEQSGWKFHSVFMIQHKTCLGLASTNTYLGVFEAPRA